MDATTRAERRELSRHGAFVRRRAKSSIRRRKGTSEPGKPPFSHMGLLRDHIYFVAEFASGRAGVIIGPARLNKTIGDAPHALEYGGESEKVRFTKGKGRELVPVFVRARPFMHPAQAAELEKLPERWRGSIKG